MEENKGIDILRFGLLGCSDIAPTALIKPARNLPNVEIVAVAARDEARAIKYAKKHAIPRVHPRYEDLIKDPEIDAIYISTPNSHHCKWALEAMAAGKHVLCEKPLASNAEECQQLAAAAQKNGVLLMEAFHYIYHPMMARLKELIKKDIDKIKHIDVKLCFPIFSGKDIRYNYTLSGGALMDAGCYTISAVRFLLEEEPEVVSATTKLASPFVDQATTAHLTAPSGATATITASIWSIIPDITLMVEGENGVKLSVVNWVAPHMMYNLLKIEDKNGEWREEKFSRKISTYQHQLAAFIAAVRSGDYSNILTDGIWGVANQSVIDAIYTRLGLPLRGADVAESEPAAATPAPSQ